MAKTKRQDANRVGWYPVLGYKYYQNYITIFSLCDIVLLFVTSQ